MEGTVIASAEWLASIKASLDAVESAGQATAAGSLAVQHLDEAQQALGGSWSAWQSRAVVDLADYATKIVEKTNPLLGDPERDVTDDVAWIALYSQIFSAYTYMKVVSGQFGEGEDSGLWDAAVVPMAQYLGEAILEAPKVVVQTIGEVGSTIGSAVGTAAAGTLGGVLGPLKWYLVGAVVLVGAFILLARKRG
jgi:hypothetical protein